MALADMMGWNNPFTNFVGDNRNSIIGFGAGLAQGKGLQEGLAMGAQGLQQGRPRDDAYAITKRAEEERLAQINQTSEWLKANYPQYAGLPPAEGFRAAMTEMGRTMGGAGQERFFGNVIPMQDAQGNVVLGQASDQGNWQPLQGAEGFSPAPTTKQIDAGNYVITTDVYGNELYRTPKSGSVPTGFQHTPEGGGVMPMPGSDVDRERQAGQVQATSAMNSLETKNQIAVQAIDSALQQASGMNTGNVMGNSGWVPFLGQGATDLSKVLDTIKANIGFEELQTMRDNSPTGGALGQVTERELAFLQSTIANIEQSQSEEQLRHHLQILRNFLLQSQEQRRAAFQRQYGGGGGQTAPAAGGIPSGVTIRQVQ